MTTSNICHNIARLLKEPECDIRFIELDRIKASQMLGSGTARRTRFFYFKTVVVPIQFLE